MVSTSIVAAAASRDHDGKLLQAAWRRAVCRSRRRTRVGIQGGVGGGSGARPAHSASAARCQGSPPPPRTAAGDRGRGRGGAALRLVAELSADCRGTNPGISSAAAGLEASQGLDPRGRHRRTSLV